MDRPAGDRTAADRCAAGIGPVAVGPAAAVRAVRGPVELPERRHPVGIPTARRLGVSHAEGLGLLGNGGVVLFAAGVRPTRPAVDATLARSEYAGLVSGSSSALVTARDRPRDPAGGWAARTGWVEPAGRTGWVERTGWAARTGWVAIGDGCVAVG